MRTWWLLIGFVTLALAVPAMAKEWWRQWDGGWPEAQEWKYNDWGDPAKRWLEPGKLVIDSRPPNGRYASHRIEYPNGGLSPGPGETFVMKWRLKVIDMASYVDLSVGFIGDNLYGIGLNFGKGYVYNLGANLGNFTLGEFHEFELRTRDMRTFTLAIDHQVTGVGTFLDWSGPPRVSWGDGAGGYSLSEWDWVGYGLTHDARLMKPAPASDEAQQALAPEPTAGLLLAAMLGALRRTREEAEA